MYTIAPVYDLGKIRHVHRTMLKAQFQLNPQDSPPVTVMPPQEDTGEDLWLLVSTTSDGSGSAPTRSPSSNHLASGEKPVLAIPDVQESSLLSPPTAQPGRPVPSLHAVTLYDGLLVQQQGNIPIYITFPRGLLVGLFVLLGLRLRLFRLCLGLGISSALL